MTVGMNILRQFHKLVVLVFNALIVLLVLHCCYVTIREVSHPISRPASHTLRKIGPNEQVFACISVLFQW